MKTRCIFILGILSLARFAQAQDNSKSFIDISTGVSAPVGAFSHASAGSFDHWNNTAGFAKTGFAAGVSGAWYFSKHIGAGGTLSFSDHGGLSRKDAATLSASYTDAFAVDESTVSTTGRYRSLTFLAGPYFSFPVKKKWTVDIRLMAGVIKSLSTPGMTVLLEDQTAATFLQRSSTASAFGWQAGGGLRYALTDKLGLSVRADYFQSAGVAIENDNRPNNAGRLVTKQPLAWINGTAGIFFTL